MASIYKPGESGVFYAQVLNGDGTPANSATVTLTVWKSDGSKFLNGVAMSYITASNGIYKYAVTAPATVERMVADVSSTSPTAYGTEDIYVADWAKDIATIEGKLPSDYIMGSTVLTAKDDEIDVIVAATLLIKAQTDKFLFDVSNFVKSIAQNTELAHLDADISSRETPAHVTALANAIVLQIDDLITRAKGLNEIYDNVALRALEATLTAIKGSTWTTETLKAIYDAISGVGTAPQVIRDAMKLAPSVGAPAAESIDKHLDDLVSGAEPPPKESFKI